MKLGDRDCHHSNCSMFEGGVDSMPGMVGFSYLMCNDCSIIIAIRDDKTDDQLWIDGQYKVSDVWKKLDRVKDIATNINNRKKFCPFCGEKL